ncbi:MAG: integrase/recombinase XerD [Solirubrobacteraceae bacterium]|nr:integrase/recombinase XerD [Solirubrobacteraceae bacterium]
MTTTLVSRGRAHGGESLELVDDFDEQALAIATMAAAPNTRRAYATAYRAFAAFLRARYGEASRETITIGAVAAWRDELTAQGLAPSSVAQRVSAVRRLAATLGADPLVQQVRCTHVQQEKPRALSDVELERLLRHPDRRTVIGIRDRAILELLARAGLRRAELAHLTLSDIKERGRQPDARRRTAIAPGRSEQTRLEVAVRASKRGRTRTVPLHAEAHDALARWYASRPTSDSDTLFVSLRERRSARPEAMSASAVGDVVTKHAACAGVREDRRTAHALRHTFCTMLAERDVALEVIRELAGHVDVRTTQIYVDVTDQRKNDGIAALERTAHPLAR